MLSIMSRSRWVPTSRTSWPLSASGKLSAVAMMPDPRTLTVVIVFPPKSQNKVQRADQTSKSHANPPHYTSSIDFSLESEMGVQGAKSPAGARGVLATSLSTSPPEAAKQIIRENRKALTTQKQKERGTKL